MPSFCTWCVLPLGYGSCAVCHLAWIIESYAIADMLGVLAVHLALETKGA